MRIPTVKFVLIVLAALLINAIPTCAQDANVPHLEKHGAAAQLIVDGKPFLMLGGELYNSSSSSLEYMKPLWPRLAAIPLNTVVTPLSWELIEPAEGKYDFALVDGLLAQAREQHVRVVSLWLASWKNGMSSYPPCGSSKTPSAFRESCCTTTKPASSAPLPAIPMPRAMPMPGPSPR